MAHFNRGNDDSPDLGVQAQVSSMNDHEYKVLNCLEQSLAKQSVLKVQKGYSWKGNL